MILIRLAVVLALAADSAPQLKFDLHGVSGVPSLRLRETQRRQRTISRLPWRAPAAEEERAVVNAVLRAYRLRFRPEAETEPRIATLTEGGQDVLVMHWTPRGHAGGLSEVAVWNTPNDTTLIFKLPPRSWSNDAALRSTFEQLLVSPNVDRRTPPAEGVILNIAVDLRTGMRIGAGGLLENYFPRQFALPGYLNWIDCWETSAASYLAVGFDESTTPDLPAELRRIPERFPPLDVRAKTWSKKRILDELSHRPDSQIMDVLQEAQFKRKLTAVEAREYRRLYISHVWGSERDRMLARELLQRDLTGDELLGLWRVRERHENGTILDAIVQAGAAPRFAEAIRTYLRQGGFPEGKEANPFVAVGRERSVDFTDTALEVLRADPRADSAFRYAAAYGETADVYRELKQLARPAPPFDNGRGFTLREMRKRLKLDEDGNPLQAR